MHRVLTAFLLLFGLVVSSGCFSRSTEPVHREGQSPGRMKAKNAAGEGGAKGDKGKKSGGLIPEN